MSTTYSQLPALAIAPRPFDPRHPYEDDLFDRSRLAARLTGLLDRLPDGGVITIDGGWGDGKSWFGQRWQAALKDQGYRTAFLDAFASDYMDDPYLLLASELQKLFDKETPARKAFNERAIALGKVLLPALGKGALQGLAKFVVGNVGAKTFSDALEKAAATFAESAANDLGKALKARLEELEARKETEEAFKESLKECATASSRPVVIFIDELDRCRPAFAVQLLERAKHFFEVPGVVFVLLLNRDQLERAVRGVYGDIDARLYLSKFIILTISLPKRVDPARGHNDYYKDYLTDLGARLGYSVDEPFDNFTRSLGGMAAILQMSYREIDRAMAYYGLVAPVPFYRATLVGYLVALRVRNHDMFKVIRERDHSAALKFVKDLIAVYGPDAYPLQQVSFLHIAARDGFDRVPEAARADVDAVGKTREDVERVFVEYTELIDLSVRMT